MNHKLQTGLIVLGLSVLGWVALGDDGRPATVAPATPQTGVIAFESATANDVRQLTIIDQQARTICVYHVRQDTGEISLKSIRNFEWDTQMLEFNSQSPTPREIRSMLQH